MKLRSGLVSNSSSTAYIIEFDKMPVWVQHSIELLGNYSHSTCRCTGFIRDTDLEDWYNDYCNGLASDDPHDIRQYFRPGVWLVRESDEAMGGTFRDVGLILDELRPYILHEFEYH